MAERTVSIRMAMLIGEAAEMEVDVVEEGINGVHILIVVVASLVFDTSIKFFMSLAFRTFFLKSIETGRTPFSLCHMTCRDLQKLPTKSETGSTRIFQGIRQVKATTEHL